MLASVTERTHEIGIRKSLGARRSDILWQFVRESGMMAAMGGIGGVLLSVVIARVVNMFFTAAVPLIAVVVGVGLSAAVGLFFGIYPARKAALLEPVAEGHVVLGYEIHRSLKLKVGDTIPFQGHSLVVSALQPQRGNQDDITLWINLREAQQILGKEGKINAIQALECTCAVDRLGQVREEVGRVLPDTQVIEFSSQALARAEARNRAAAEASEAIQREQAGRAEARERTAAEAGEAIQHEQAGRAAAARQRERLFAVLAPLVIGACAVWAGLLALGNVRSRSSEIGILRALGVPTGRVLAILLIRAALIGLVGASIGFLVGWLGSWYGENRIAGGPPLEALFDPRLFAMVLLLTPILSVVIGWLPAIWAAQLDPADSLRAGAAT